MIGNVSMMFHGTTAVNGVMPDLLLERDTNER